MVLVWVLDMHKLPMFCVFDILLDMHKEVLSFASDLYKVVLLLTLKMHKVVVFWASELHKVMLFWTFNLTLWYISGPSTVTI